MLFRNIANPCWKKLTSIKWIKTFMLLKNFSGFDSSISPPLNKCAIPTTEILNNSKQSNIIPKLFLANEFFNLRFVSCTNHVNAGTCASFKLEHVCRAVIWMKRKRCIKNNSFEWLAFSPFHPTWKCISIRQMCSTFKHVLICTYVRNCNTFQSFCEERIVTYTSQATQLKFSANDFFCV